MAAGAGIQWAPDPDQAPMATRNYDVFISYRRQGGDAQALFIREKLLQHNIRVFLDVTDLKKGYFDEELLARIGEAPNFVVILSPNSLDRCQDEADWLRQEIGQAVKTNRNIIPVMMPGFGFPQELPAEVQAIRRHQGVEYSHVYSEGMLARILESIEADRAERDRTEKKKKEAERQEQEKSEAKRRAAEQAEASRIAREKADRERRAQEKAQEERLAKEKAAQERLAREKAEAEKRAKEAELERQAAKKLEGDRRTVPAAVVPAAPPVAPAVARRKSPWVLVAGGAVALLVVTIIYLKSNSNNQTPPVQIAQKPAQSASGSSGEPQPVASQPVGGSQTTAYRHARRQAVSQQQTTHPPPDQASRTPLSFLLPSLVQQAGGEDIGTDPRTGLMWTSKDNGSDISWDSANQYCAQLSLGGYSGWRLPTTEELTGIYDPNNVSGKYQLGNELLALHTIKGFHLSSNVIWFGNGDSAGFFRFNDGQHVRVRRENLQGIDGNDGGLEFVLKNPALCVRSSNP